MSSQSLWSKRGMIGRFSPSLKSLLNRMPNRKKLTKETTPQLPKNCAPAISDPLSVKMTGSSRQPIYPSRWKRGKLQAMQLSPNSTEAKDHSEYVKQSLKAQLEEQERRIDEVDCKLQLMTKCFKEKIQDMNT
ncbi:uncharacterized protein LOC110055466 [Orbicella faveolata]|uniref:uncharacterized protein LOC110055466 n=1 Tax=Orbicella faveolata TaxID=48498 RepID=UPI0009E4E26C|nr:uncharacterized protein LOC110055466 [Orbicella faveolata]